MQDTVDGKPAAAGDWAADPVVEAARYVMLRRLAYAMRHHMVVHLQPIGMITEVMERRLQASAPDLAQVHESMSKINGFSKAAVQSCLDVVSWLAPAGEELVALDAGVQECVALLRSNFNFRGFTLKDEVGSAPGMVSRTGLRYVLPASLLALSDNASLPSDIVISAQQQPGQAVLSVTVRPNDGSAGFAGDKPYRQMEWSEVGALAQAEDIGFEHGAQEVRLVLEYRDRGPGAGGRENTLHA